MSSSGFLLRLRVSIVDTTKEGNGDSQSTTSLPPPKPALLLPVVDARTTVLGFMQRVEHDWQETFFNTQERNDGSHSIKVGVLRDGNGLALPPSALIADLVTDNDIIIAELKATDGNGNGIVNERSNGQTDIGEKSRAADSLSDWICGKHSDQRNVSSKMSMRATPIHADAIAETWERETCTILNRFVESYSEFIEVTETGSSEMETKNDGLTIDFCPSMIEMLNTLSRHQSIKIKACVAHALLTLAEAWSIAGVSKSTYESKRWSDKPRTHRLMASTLIAPIIHLMPQAHVEGNTNCDVLVYAPSIAINALFTILNSGSISPKEILVACHMNIKQTSLDSTSRREPLEYDGTARIVKLLTLLCLDSCSTSTFVKSAKTVLMSMELMIIDDDVRLSFFRHGVMAAMIAVMERCIRNQSSDGIILRELGTGAANLLVRFSDITHVAPVDETKLDSLPLSSLMSLLDAAKLESQSSQQSKSLYRVVALGLQAWFPLLDSDDSLARTNFLNAVSTKDFGETEFESHGMALIWHLGDTVEYDVRVTAACAAAKVAGMGFEGKDCVTRGRGLLQLVRWMRGEAGETVKDNLPVSSERKRMEDEVQHFACVAIASAVLHEVVHKRVERMLGKQDR